MLHVRQKNRFGYMKDPLFLVGEPEELTEEQLEALSKRLPSARKPRGGG